MRSRSRTGFALIELLAVLTLCGLLFSMAAPGLTAARTRSRQAVCLERLGTISRASRIYAADDEQGFAIPAHRSLLYLDYYETLPFVGAYEWGGKSGVGRPGWTSGPSAGEFAWISSRYGTRAGFGPATRPLNKILFPHGFRDNLSLTFEREPANADRKLELPVYRCPADDGPPEGAHCPDWVSKPTQSSYDHFGTSFAANIFMTSSAVPGDEMLSNSPYLRPLSRVPNPGRTIEYEENIGRWAWACRREIEACSFIGQGVDPGPSGAVRGWHGKDWTYNRVFMDAHAERQTIYIEGTEDAEGFANHYYNELVFPDDPDMQEAYRCIIVRGDGWQKDTLPAPRIPTGVPFSLNGRPSYEDCVQTD